ncbi:MAG: class I SAM-dependent methyltransferase [Syntrophorhabdus aromaticivorans]|uniref:Class I SAM-dependent methyltransferase n=1 Tax=Syntrophorhabdus aromaticivorans TaxID=328301 RepID=A0A971S126_9BACT|nr:class I SAM-dependent methyltransferase [Syntrophorhabdus aromaticivorans]
MPKAKTRLWQNHKGPVLDLVKGFEIIACETCGFKHIVPIPSSSELEEIYRQEYYSKDKPLYLEQHEEDLSWWNCVYAERYALFESYLPPARRRILDVGSGPGYFLLHGLDRGWETIGIEPSSRAAAYSRTLGLMIIEDFFTPQTAERLGTFDAIHMSEVLEHIPGPKGLLEIAGRLLAPGGLICVVVPNDYNPFQDILQKTCGFAPWWIAPPHHINYFDVESIQRLLVAAGFDVLHTQTTFPIDIFLLMGDNYIGNDVLGRQCHARRKTFELALVSAEASDLKRRLYQSFAALGIGREVLVCGRKP